MVSQAKHFQCMMYQAESGVIASGVTTGALLFALKSLAPGRNPQVGSVSGEQPCKELPWGQEGCWAPRRDPHCLWAQMSPAFIPAALKCPFL